MRFVNLWSSNIENKLDEYNDMKRKKPDRNGRQNAETHILGKHKSRFIRSKVIESNKCVI